MTFEQAFGYEVRRRRKAIDVTQYDLAEHLGLSRMTILQVERGCKSRITFRNAMAIANVLRIDLAQFSPLVPVEDLGAKRAAEIKRQIETLKAKMAELALGDKAG